MRLSLFIAHRYLFSSKKQNAINIISAISTVGVAIGTIALIVVLSVFNGMDQLLQESTNSFSPDLQISPLQGKFFERDSSLFLLLRHSAIANYDEVIEEKALVKYGEKMTPVTVKGVKEKYATHTHFHKHIIDGEFLLKKEDEYQAILGYGVASNLQVGSQIGTPLIFYYPDRETQSSTVSALNSQQAHPIALFSAQQELDDQFVLTDIQLAQKLFGIKNQISKIEIRLKDPTVKEQIKKELKEKLAHNYRIEDKYELNRAFYSMIKSEKLAVFCILLFILLIASFNIVGSISMLILDKKEDLNTYKALGMTPQKLISIFKIEGNLITGLGALLGLIIGVGLCLLQETFGFITLGDGNYIVNAYPVKLILKDIILILITVLFIGYMASYFPVKYLIKKLNE